jgi:NitT/TauT family transport system substrate-binding protein
VLCEAFCVGSEVASPEIDKETYAAIQRAINGAVSLINHNKKKYLHYLLDDVPKRIGFLKPNQLHLPRLQYADPAPYPLDEFNRAYDWMVSWNLIPPGGSFEDMVDNRISAEF